MLSVRRHLKSFTDSSAVLSSTPPAFVPAYLPNEAHRPRQATTDYSSDPCFLFRAVFTWHVDRLSLTWVGGEKKGHVHLGLIWQEWIHISSSTYIFSFKSRSPIPSSIICTNRGETQIWITNSQFTVKSNTSISYMCILVSMLCVSLMWLKLMLGNDNEPQKGVGHLLGTKHCWTP